MMTRRRLLAWLLSGAGALVGLSALPRDEAAAWAPHANGVRMGTPARSAYKPTRKPRKPRKPTPTPDPAPTSTITPALDYLLDEAGNRLLDETGAYLIST